LAINALVISDTNLFAGTGGSGVWRRPLSEIVTSADDISTDLPTHFSLEQNYPNPFNPTTNIKFQIPSTSFVSLRVFDMLGREVATLANEEMRPGGYERTVQRNIFLSARVRELLPNEEAPSH
jgi:hypothetical protein